MPADNTDSGPLIDCAGFPIVRVNAPAATLSEAAAAALLSDLDAVLQRGARYAVVAQGGPPDLPEKARGDFARWFKRERQTLAALCAGMVFIMPDPQARASLTAQLEAAAQHGLYPYPVTTADAEKPALSWAEASLRRGGPPPS